MMRVMSANRGKAQSSVDDAAQILVELQKLNASLQQMNARLEMLEERNVESREQGS